MATFIKHSLSHQYQSIHKMKHQIRYLFVCMVALAAFTKAPAQIDANFDRKKVRDIQEEKLCDQNQKKVDAWTTEGITGPVHEANAGKVVFAGTRISRDSMNSPSLALKTEFQAGEEVFARAYFEKAIVQNILTNGEINIEREGGADEYCTLVSLIAIDGKQVDLGPTGYDYFDVDAKVNGKYITTVQLMVFNDGDRGQIPSAVAEQIADWGPGVHKIDMCVYGVERSVMPQAFSEKPLACGSFTMVVKE
jgi:hypothetical protein